MVDPFQDQEAWGGGTFDVLLYLGSVSIERANEISNWLWTYDRLDGPYREQCGPAGVESIAVPNCAEGLQQLYGRFRLSDDYISSFVQTTIRDDDGTWIYAGIPMKGLPTSWQVGAYPFDDGRPLEWTAGLIEILRNVAAHTRKRFEVPAAVYGWLTADVTEMVRGALCGKFHADRWYPIEVVTDTGTKDYPRTRTDALIRSI